MALVFSETSDSWPIAWFLRIHPSSPEGGLGSWPAALCVCQGECGQPAEVGSISESELVWFRSLVQP